MAEVVRDPVCGMEIDAGSAAGSSTYQGITYYFCAEECKRQFDADPAKYVQAPSGPQSMPAEPETPAGARGQARPRSKRWWEFWK